MKELTIDQAMAIIAQICANVHGTLKDHQTIQQALQVIEQALAKRDDAPIAKPDRPTPNNPE